jgi:hypothetical protein
LRLLRSGTLVREPDFAASIGAAFQSLKASGALFGEGVEGRRAGA